MPPVAAALLQAARPPHSQTAMDARGPSMPGCCTTGGETVCASAARGEAGRGRASRVGAGSWGGSAFPSGGPLCGSVGHKSWGGGVGRPPPFARYIEYRRIGAAGLLALLQATAGGLQL
jgi:hypothetical protein